MIMSTIEQNLQAVRHSIAQAALEQRRAPEDVTLLAVSENIRRGRRVLAAMRAGQAAFGENYLQEALDKIARRRPRRMSRHGISSAPSRSEAKTRPIAEHFDWHTVERERSLSACPEQRPAGSAGPEYLSASQYQRRSEQERRDAVYSMAAGGVAARLPRLQVSSMGPAIMSEL